MEKDLAVAMFGAAVSLAGLILVFIGFVFTRAESMGTAALTKKYKNVARGGVIPLIPLMASGWLCLNYLSGDPGAYGLALLAFRTGFVVTAVYALVVLFIYI